VSWLDTYLTYTERQVSPRCFHLWSGIAVLAAVLERRVWFPALGGRVVLYPGQTMVILVSKSAVTKKTTAATMAVNLLRELAPWQLYRLPGKLSPQQLLYDLQRLDEDKVPLRDPDGRRVNSAGFLFAGELGAMFSSEAFAETLATQINNLNDCPKGHFRIAFRSWNNGKPVDLWQPCVTLLGCITPKGIADELPKAARSAGFFGRLLLVHRSYTERRVSLMDDAPDLSPELERTLMQEVAEIACMRGRFTFTKKAVAWHKEWYYDVYEPGIRQGDQAESESTGYWGRKEAHLIRTAMVLSASERRDRVGQRQHLESALRYLEEIEREFPAAMMEIGTSPYSEYDRRLVEVLERFTRVEAWCPEERLRRALLRHGGDRRFAEAKETLKRAGEVEVRTLDGKREWRRLYSQGRLLRQTGEEGVATGQAGGAAEPPPTVPVPRGSQRPATFLA
jgi:hypothetical protein